MLYVAPVAKLIRAAAGRFEVVGAGACGADAEVELGSGEVGVNGGVEVGCVGLPAGVSACNVSVTMVEIGVGDGNDVNVPPQAVATIKSTTATIFKAEDGLRKFILSPFPGTPKYHPDCQF